MNTPTHSIIAKAINCGVDIDQVKMLVRGCYDLQSNRMQTGGRLCSNFKAELGQSPDGMPEKDLSAEKQKILDILRKDYVRITDGIVVAEADSLAVVLQGKIPTPGKFKAVGIIDTYTKLQLVHQYMSLVLEEEKLFASLKYILKGVPIYEHFLKDVPGIGPAIAGVIISEMDIYKAKYPSSFWAYAGLDTVTVAIYTDDNGKEQTIPATEAMVEWKNQGHNTYIVDGLYTAKLINVGRSRKKFCLVKREYNDKEGAVSVRDSITFNPLLKTKLIGVLGPSFLRVGNTYVDEVRLGASKRMELAVEKGYVATSSSPAEEQQLVLSFLKSCGCVIRVDRGMFGHHYYDYKARLEQHPNHMGKTAGWRHNMAIRYMIKMFLQELHRVWSALEDLEPTTPYAEGKLGYHHGVNPNAVT